MLLSDERTARVSPPAGSHDDQLYKKSWVEVFPFSENPTDLIQNNKNLSKIYKTLILLRTEYKKPKHKWDPHVYDYPKSQLGLSNTKTQKQRRHPPRINTTIFRSIKKLFWTIWGIDKSHSMKTDEFKSHRYVKVWSSAPSLFPKISAWRQRDRRQVKSPAGLFTVQCIIVLFLLCLPCSFN